MKQYVQQKINLTKIDFKSWL